MKSWETKHLFGEMTEGHNEHPLLARDWKLLENLLSVAWRKKWSRLVFSFPFLKNLSLSSPFIPYQALPVLTFKFWFILNTIAHLANSFIPLSNKYLFCSPLVHINICSKSICGHMHMPHNIYVS